MVGYPHDIKGQGIYAYVTLMAGEQPSEELRKELVQWVRKEIGPIASPDLIQFAPGLPKTRSGKIMRRILRKIAEDEFTNLGDTSTLADPAVVDDLVKNRQNRKDGDGAKPVAAGGRSGCRSCGGCRGRRRQSRPPAENAAATSTAGEARVFPPPVRWIIRRAPLQECHTRREIYRIHILLLDKKRWPI